MAVQGTVPQARLAESGAPFGDAAQAIFGGAWAAKAIAAVALISALGSLNGFHLSTPRWRRAPRTTASSRGSCVVACADCPCRHWCSTRSSPPR